MSTVNPILAVRDDTLALIKAFLANPDSYSGPITPRVRRVLRLIPDTDFERLGRVDTVGGRTWTAFSLYLRERDYTLQQARDEVENMIDTSAGTIVIVGAWWFDRVGYDSNGVLKALQVGMDTDGDGAITGTALYPLHSRLYELFPDTLAGDPPAPLPRPTSNAEIPVWLAAGGSDLNKVAGQADRYYGS